MKIIIKWIENDNENDNNDNDNKLNNNGKLFIPIFNVIYMKINNNGDNKCK